jgi:hypothetical protein
MVWRGARCVVREHLWSSVATDLHEWPGVEVLLPRDIAQRVVESGLTGWLVQKVQ